MVKIRIKNLSKEFTVYTRGGVKIQGYNNVDFEVKKGEFLSLYGHSGIGKSSLLKAIYRTYTTTSGDIIFTKEDGTTVNIAKCDEKDIIELRKTEIGYVSQFLKVLPRISALEIVAAPLIEKGESEKVAKIKAKELLDFFGIKEELFNVSPLTFSGGEQQRVNIAKELIAPKPFLLLDEPTASLDYANTMKVIKQLQKLKENNVTMIGIFHDQDDLKTISDKIYDFALKKYVEV